jgi:hypothetical protein
VENPDPQPVRAGTAEIHTSSYSIAAIFFALLDLDSQSSGRSWRIGAASAFCAEALIDPQLSGFSNFGFFVFVFVAS